MNRLKKDDNKVVAPTDKTNRYVLVKTEDHNRWMQRNLADEGALEISHTRLRQIFAQALELLNKIGPILSESKYMYIKSMITKKAIQQYSC
jgi:hypothetical protein